MHDNRVKILITGDLCPVNRPETILSNNGQYSFFSDFTDVLDCNDIVISDLECPLTLSESARKKIGPFQKAHPVCIKILEEAKVNIAAMANNHIMDYGRSGLEETLALLETRNIQALGIGKTLESAAIPYTLNIKNKKIAILNYTDNEFISVPDGSYFCNPLDPVSCFYHISEAKQLHDYVLIIVHAGNEFYELPSPRTKRLYHYLIDAGADAVIGHHTHAYSGVELYNSRPIFYSLGNFFYDWPGRTGTPWNRGFVIRFSLSDRMDFDIIPYKQCDGDPGVFHLDSAEDGHFRNEIERLNTIIADDDTLEAEFRRYVDSVTHKYDAYVEPDLSRFITALRRRRLFPRVMSQKKRLLLLNIVRCESHRDVLLRILRKYEQ